MEQVVLMNNSDIQSLKKVDHFQESQHETSNRALETTELTINL